MAKYRITAPDGTEHIVEGEGTPAQALAHFKANWKPAEVAGPTIPKDMMAVGSRPKEFVSPETAPARMVFGQDRQRLVPKESPVDRGIYEAGGLTVDAATKMGLPPEAAAAIGYLTNLGLQVGTTFAGGVPGKALEPAVQQLGTRVMRSALNPTAKQVETGVAGAAAETMVKEGRMVTRSDVEGMTNDINKLNTEIMATVKNSPDTVNKTRVAMYVKRAYDKWFEQVNKATDVNAVKAAVKEFLDDPTIAENMTAAAAQKLKQGTYRALGDKAYEPGKAGVTANIDAQKDLAFGLKEELASKHPGISELNAREGALIEARKLAEKALAKDDARQFAGMGWLANHPEGAIGWLAERSPWAKSLLAKYLYEHADPEMLGRVVGAAAGAHSGAPPSSLQQIYEQSR